MGHTAHDTDLYTIGKGIVYFDKLDSTGLPTGLRDLGNAPSFLLTPTIEKLKHPSSREGIQKIDKVVNLSIGITAKFTLDEYDLENLALALLGEISGNILNLLAANQIEGYLKFISNNACGPNCIVNLWRVILQCNADVNFITNEWGTIDFEAELQDDQENHPTQPYGTIERIIAS